MIVDTKYIRPNITIEIERIGLREFFVYNDKGISYKVFKSVKNAQEFSESGNAEWIFDCDTEEELESCFAEWTVTDSEKTSEK